MSDKAHTVFVVGAMTGLPFFNFPAFLAVEERLMARGHSTRSMRRIVMEEYKGDTSLPSEVYMRRALIELASCTALCIVPGPWSENVKVEVLIAHRLKLALLNVDGEEIPMPLYSLGVFKP